MRCRPNDLAQIVAPYLDKPRIGLTVHVIRLGRRHETIWSRNGEHCTNEGFGGPGWLCDAHADGFPCFIGDEFLRPIRDPGPDAVDETLAWKPVPAGQPAEAAEVPHA